jgi:hypothetical protein
MINTDKEVKNILFDLGVEGNQYGDLVEYISNLIAEVKRFRWIAENCLQAIEAGGDIRSGTIELIEENLKGMIE